MMLSLALLVILFAAGVFVQSMLFCGFLIGLAFGVFFRDRAWRDAQTAAWSFYSQVIDWPKVKQLAKGEPAARLDPVATG